MLYNIDTYTRPPKELYASPQPANEPDPALVEELELYMHGTTAQTWLYNYCGESRDLDIATFQQLLIYHLPKPMRARYRFEGEGEEDGFEDLILAIIGRKPEGEERVFW